MVFEWLTNIAKSQWGIFFQFQKKQVEISRKPQRREEHLNPALDLCAAWTELYEKEVHRYLSIPPLGLVRFHQERMREVWDKFNLLQGRTMRFLSSLTLPLEKSFKGAQEKLDELNRKGKISQDPKEYYQTWIKVLEDYYLAFLRSSEYRQTMEGALSALAEFMIARQKFFQSFLQMNSIATTAELDDLSRDFYLMKKKMREMERKLVDWEQNRAGVKFGAKFLPSNGGQVFTRVKKRTKQGDSHVHA